MSPLILVVDDDPNSLALMAYALELEGFQVEQAEDGKQALAVAPNVQPALCILDVMLPDLSGLEVCQRMRALPGLKQIKIIMLSAKAENSDRSRGLEAGADIYLTKPAEPDEVVRNVKELLGDKA